MPDETAIRGYNLIPYPFLFRLKSQFTQQTRIQKIENMMPDRGPIYRETDMSAVIKEPLNMVTAALFAVLAIYWIVRLHTRRQEFMFLYVLNWVLLIGGIGGTIFHGFRWHFVFLAMDFLPTLVLVLATALRYWFKVLPSKKWALLPVALLFVTRPLLMLSSLPKQTLIGLSYGSLGLFILLPVVWYLACYRAQNAWLVVCSVITFLIALFFRTYDMAPYFVVISGGHWLWHIFGWLSVLCLELYIFRDLALPHSQPGRHILLENT